MRGVIALMIVIAFMITGCTATPVKGVDVYTFKKDRVDQTVQGNRGYLEGEAPEPPAERSSKRTLIGVDVEVPGSFAGSSSKTKVSGTEEIKTSGSSGEEVITKTRVESEEKYIK